MSVFLQPIYTQTASGSASSIFFQNIPQSFTDLAVYCSARSTTTSSNSDGLAFIFNEDSSSIYSLTALRNNSGSANSYRFTNSGPVNFTQIPSALLTANTFSSDFSYIPNYSSSNFKQVVCDWTGESNTSSWDSVGGMHSILYRSTAAITRIRISANTGLSFAANSTFSLYGVLRQGI